MCSLEKRADVFILTLTGPTSEHRLSLPLISSLRETLALVRSESLSSSSSNALVTCADGNFFSNGFDLAFCNSAPTPSARASRLHSMVSSFIPLVADLLSLPMPTIAAVTGHAAAAVTGHAAAAGFMLALSHDYTVMRSDRGVLYMSEMDLGLPFPPYFLQIMREKIRDLGIYKDIVMKGRKVRALEAKERGVVDEVRGTREETLQTAVEMAEVFVRRKWGGKVYASIRMGSFPGICRAVGLEEETEEERTSLFASKL